MSTLTRMALGAMGKLRPRPVHRHSESSITLPPFEKHGGLPLLDALSQRRSSRDFEATPLPLPLLSQLLWSAFGVNRNGGHRTAPTAMDCQEIDLYVALPGGAYVYDATAHALHLAVPSDVRRVTGYQDFVDDAPLDLVFVADHRRMTLVPAAQRQSYAFVSAGAMAQNVYLYCASAGLATVIRAWFDRTALSQAMGLEADQDLLLSQTVGAVPVAGTV